MAIPFVCIIVVAFLFPNNVSANPISARDSIVGPPGPSGSLEGCSMASMGKCYKFMDTEDAAPENLIEEIGQVSDVQVCQSFCKELYLDTCNWFMFDRTTKDCKLFKGSVSDFEEDCREEGYMKEPSLDLCESEFDPSAENGCFNFREDYCRYEFSLLENLENIMTLSDCQQACEYIDNCTYFQFDKNEKICKLHSDQVATRVCDIVHGTQEPDFQTCLDMGSLRWALGGMTSTSGSTDSPSTSDAGSSSSTDSSTGYSSSTDSSTGASSSTDYSTGNSTDSSTSGSTSNYNTTAVSGPVACGTGAYYQGTLIDDDTTVSSPLECRQKCALNFDCQFWDYGPFIVGYICRLHSDEGMGPEASDGSFYGTWNCYFEATTPAPLGPTTYCWWC